MDQLVTALTTGNSALITGSTGTTALLAATAAVLMDRPARVLRVRPPLDLLAFMDQIGQTGPEVGDTQLEKVFTALTVPDAGSDWIVLLIDEAHLLAPATLHYIEFALRSGPQLQVAFAGQQEFADSLDKGGFNGLRERISLCIILPTGPTRLPPVSVLLPSLGGPKRHPGSMLRKGLVGKAMAGAACGMGLAVAAWALVPAAPRPVVPAMAKADPDGRVGGPHATAGVAPGPALARPEPAPTIEPAHPSAKQPGVVLVASARRLEPTGVTSLVTPAAFFTVPHSLPSVGQRVADPEPATTDAPPADSITPQLSPDQAGIGGSAAVPEAPAVAGTDVTPFIAVDEPAPTADLAPTDEPAPGPGASQDRATLPEPGAADASQAPATEAGAAPSGPVLAEPVAPDPAPDQVSEQLLDQVPVPAPAPAPFAPAEPVIANPTPVPSRNEVEAPPVPTAVQPPALEPRPARAVAPLPYAPQPAPVLLPVPQPSAPVLPPSPALAVPLSPPPTPPAPLSPAPAPSAASSALADLMVRRADAMLQSGDLSAARLLYDRAANAGSGRAATAMGKTFDAAFLAQIGVVGPRPDPDQAVAWYRRAAALGDEEALARLRTLRATATPPAPVPEKRP